MVGSGNTQGITASFSRDNSQVAFGSWDSSLMDEYVTIRDPQLNILKELRSMPNILRETLKCHDQVAAIAEKYYHVRNMLYLGRQFLFPLALDGSARPFRTARAWTRRAGGTIRQITLRSSPSLHSELTSWRT